IRLDPLSATQSYAALSAARIQADDAKRFYERMAPLYEAGAVAKEDFDRAKSSYDMARAALTDASGSMTLSSPITGTLTDVRVREGDRVDPLQTLAVVADLSGAKFVADVSQGDVEELRPGQTVAVCDDGVAIADCGARGAISRVSLSADSSSRLFRVEAELPSMESPRLGTLRYARVLVHERDGALAVPIESVITREGKTSVFVVEGDIAKRREVTIGKNDERRVEIVTGLSPGERVVVWGANRIADGAKVKVVEPVVEAAPAATEAATPEAPAAN
ncbi:MAG: efflux RND transporter periplasmic adaptor subunit, partial [Deltaproteobacteria bacterium]|nr:efflux RND transporter periplasmic adaptor subunit [Deltaproteobacteria bacterium]